VYVHNLLTTSCRVSVVCLRDYIYFSGFKFNWQRFGGKTWELGESFGTSWEHIKGTWWEQGKKGKNKILAPLLPEKGKFWIPHESMLNLSLVTWNFYLYGIKILFWFFISYTCTFNQLWLSMRITLSLLAKMYVVF
jgi:hypothetical protein